MTGKDVMNNLTYHIRYAFRFENGKTEHFDIPLDSQTLILLWPREENLPAWTKLEYRQCLCCTLTKENELYCPVAENLSRVVFRFKRILSYEKCTVRCQTNERTYVKKTSVMEGLSSIMGVVMATSRCPIMELFRPMARFHLPFSTPEETLVRSTSFYMLRQYFEFKSHHHADLDLRKLKAHCEKLQVLNEGLLARIKALREEDTDKNALLVFHSMSQILSMEITAKMQSIAYLFSSQADPGDFQE